MKALLRHPVGIILPILFVLILLLLTAVGVIPLERVGIAALVLAAIASTGFCIIYGIIAPWHESRDGRTAMFLFASLAALVDYFAIVALVGYEAESTEFFRLILFSAVFVAGWLETALLIQRQREGRYIRKTLTKGTGAL